MLVTLVSGAAAPRLRDWLTRQGLPSKPVMQGTALMVTDPWVPWHVRETLAADPEVAGLEATEAMPERVMRRDATEPALPEGLASLPIIAGPCSVDSRELAFESAAFLAGLGLTWMRGGTDKTRTSPYAFQGRGLQAAEWLREAADTHGLRVVSEVTDSPDAEGIAELVDIIQVGARHMHAPRHLQRLGRHGKPVILKRGMSASPEEWLWAAEYLLDAGAPSVLFCERGVRTAHPLKRFTLDLGAVPFIREMTSFPVLVDPSHAAGASSYVAPLARAALAAGAHGILVECHPDPARACSDALQALDFAAMTALVESIRPSWPAPTEKAGAR